ncbi:MAG TPA: transglycosylase SLT domain-containing protein [Chitinophagales bacterium]|nr:transglycosylase SLT domain-containing protein [Chitinophagales bacterium]
MQSSIALGTSELNVSKEINRTDAYDAIQKASANHGIPEKYLLTMAAIESSYNPKAKNKKTGASGLFQFMPATAREFGLSDNDCLDAKKSADAAARLTKRNLSYLRKHGINVDLNTNPEYGYLAHQQGAAGLTAIIKAAENGTELSQGIRRNMDFNGGQGKTPKEFLDFWRRRYQLMAGRAK